MQYLELPCAEVLHTAEEQLPWLAHPGQTRQHHRCLEEIDLPKFPPYLHQKGVMLRTLRMLRVL